MKTWFKSLRKAIRKLNDSYAARWPHVYRRLITTEVTELVRLNVGALTGPVVKIGTHLSPAPAGCQCVPIMGLGGGTEVLCLK